MPPFDVKGLSGLPIKSNDLKNHALRKIDFMGGNVSCHFVDGRPSGSIKANVYPPEIEDSLLLARSIIAQPKETILDIGCGIGVSSLCLSMNPDVKITCLEIDRHFVRLCTHNVELNHKRDRIEVLYADLLTPPPRLAAGTYSHVIVHANHLENYLASQLEAQTESILAKKQRFLDIKGNSKQDSKKVSEKFLNILNQWANFALLMVKPLGTVTFIQDMKRLCDVIHYFYGRLGFIQAFPIWQTKNKSSKLIIQGVKNAPIHFDLLCGIVLHNENGSYTKEADLILKYEKKIPFVQFKKESQ
jgi:tRNA1(Val) A37 N6-methylase TrmN6